MRIEFMPIVRLLRRRRELIAYEKLSAQHFGRLAFVQLRYVGDGIVGILVEIFLERRFAEKYLLPKQILLVEKENDGDFLEKTIVPYILEQVQRLLEPIARLVLAQVHVVAAAGDDENDGRHVVETLYPLATFVALTADVDDVKAHRSIGELGFEDASRQNATVEKILHVGNVIGASNHFDSIEKVLGRIDELELVRSFVHRLHGVVAPEIARPREKVVRERFVGVDRRQDAIGGRFVDERAAVTTHGA